MLAAQDRPNTEPIIAEVYASSIYSSSPIKPMPYWFYNLLTRPLSLFLTLHDAIANLNNWGILADVLCFHNLNEQVLKAHAKIAILKAKLEGLCLTRLLA